MNNFLEIFWNVLEQTLFITSTMSCVCTKKHETEDHSLQYFSITCCVKIAVLCHTCSLLIWPSNEHKSAFFYGLNQIQYELWNIEKVGI